MRLMGREEEGEADQGPALPTSLYNRTSLADVLDAGPNLISALVSCAPRPPLSM